jgi:hypothetical protein
MIFLLSKTTGVLSISIRVCQIKEGGGEKISIGSNQLEVWT